MSGRNTGGPHRRALDVAASDPQGTSQKRERDRAYRHAHADEIAAKANVWREANKDHVREGRRRWKQENPDRARELNRESMRRAATRRRRLTESRRKAQERSARWKEEHPEHVREFKKRWVADNRNKVREYYRRYHAKHRDEVNARATARRDADPEKARKARKEWADRNNDRLAELQRQYRSDPEKYRAALDSNSAAKRLNRRLERAGLPPKHVHRASAAERRANERASDAYFADPVLPEHLRQFTVLTEALAEHVIKNGTRLREFAEAYVATRERMGLPPVDVENIVYARAVEFVTDRMRRVDQLTSRDVAAAVRSAKSVISVYVRREQYVSLVEAVATYIRRHQARLTARVSAVNRARALVGQPRVPFGPLIVRTAIAEVAPAVPIVSLHAGDLRRAMDEALRRYERQNFDDHFFPLHGSLPSQTIGRSM